MEVAKQHFTKQFFPHGRFYRYFVGIIGHSNSKPYFCCKVQSLFAYIFWCHLVLVFFSEWCRVLHIEESFFLHFFLIFTADEKNFNRLLTDILASRFWSVSWPSSLLQFPICLSSSILTTFSSHLSLILVDVVIMNENLIALHWVGYVIQKLFRSGKSICSSVDDISWNIVHKNKDKKRAL